MNEDGAMPAGMAASRTRPARRPSRSSRPTTPAVRLSSPDVAVRKSSPARLLVGIVDPELEAAATAVLESEQDWRLEALDAEEVARELAGLCRSIERPEGVEEDAPGTPGQRALRRRLLELLRARLLSAWAPELPTSRGEMLRAMEALRKQLEPGWREYFHTRLAGPEGLDLAVELAHDMRSPLNSIMYLAEMLQRRDANDLDPLSRHTLQIIYSAAMGLISLVSDVVDMARGSDEEGAGELASFSLAEVFESVQEIVTPMVEERGLVLRSLVPENPHRLGYMLPLSRVVLNLVTNAIKYTDTGFVEITAVEVSPSEVEISVRDTGPGIPKSQIPKLFNPFRRRSTGTGLRISGTGLGLSICRRAVEAMGSELRVETREGWGTRFFFRLDLPRVRRW